MIITAFLFSAGVYVWYMALRPWQPWELERMAAARTQASNVVFKASVNAPVESQSWVGSVWGWFKSWFSWSNVPPSEVVKNTHEVIQKITIIGQSKVKKLTTKDVSFYELPSKKMVAIRNNDCDFRKWESGLYTRSIDEIERIGDLEKRFFYWSSWQRKRIKKNSLIETVEEKDLESFRSVKRFLHYIREPYTEEVFTIDLRNIEHVVKTIEDTVVSTSPLEQFDAIDFSILPWFGYDFTFFNILLPLILCSFLFFVFFLLFRNNLKIIPEVWQYFFESFYLFIFNMVKQQIGIKGFVYFPFIFTIFNFIFFCNVISLFPFGIALTSHIILILFLSISLCISIFCIGLTQHGLKFLRIFIPQCPFLLLPILIPIEIFSYIIRMFSLAIRLAANILAGHTLVYIISTFILMLIGINFMLYFVVVLPLFAVLLLECVVAFLQAYVFTILVCIYLNDSVNFTEH